jgi:hypothetical protein
MNRNTNNNLIGRTSQNLLEWRRRLIPGISTSTTEELALRRIGLVNNITQELARRKEALTESRRVIDVWDVMDPAKGVAPADRVINNLYRTPLTNALWRCYRDSGTKELSFIRMTNPRTGMLYAAEAKYFEGWTV